MNYSATKTKSFGANALAKLSLSIACLSVFVGAAQAQDLYNDIARLVGSYPNNYIAPVSAYELTTSSFTVGFAETPNQPLFQVTPSPFINQTLYTPASNDYDLILALKDGVSSGIFWNLHTFNYTLGSGLTLPAGTVTLSSVDFIPAVQLDLARDTSTAYTVTTVAKPVNGSSTPGNIVLQSLVGGVWTTIFSSPLSSAQFSDSRTITANHKTRLRWMLQRSGSAPAQATLSVVAYQ